MKTDRSGLTFDPESIVLALFHSAKVWKFLGDKIVTRLCIYVSVHQAIHLIYYQRQGSMSFILIP